EPLRERRVQYVWGRRRERTADQGHPAEPHPPTPPPAPQECSDLGTHRWCRPPVHTAFVGMADSLVDQETVSDPHTAAIIFRRDRKRALGPWWWLECATVRVEDHPKMDAGVR